MKMALEFLNRVDLRYQSKNEYVYPTMNSNDNLIGYSGNPSFNLCNTCNDRRCKHANNRRTNF